MADAWHDTLRALPTVAASLAILAGGWLVAAVARGLTRGAVRWAARHRIARRRFDVIAGRVAYGVVLVVALHLAFALWGPNLVSEMVTATVGLLPRLVAAIVVVAVACGLAGVVRDTAGDRAGVVPAVIVGAGVIGGLHQAGVPVVITLGALVAAGGVAVVGVGGGLIAPMRECWSRWLAPRHAVEVAEPERIDETIPIARLGSDETIVIPKG